MKATIDRYLVSDGSNEPGIASGSGGRTAGSGAERRRAPLWTLSADVILLPQNSQREVPGEAPK
jgi:hypothetical protein